MRNLRAASRVVLVVGLMLMALVPNLARADFVSQDVDFTQGDSAIQGITGAFLTNPYATMSISADATAGVVDFTVSATADNLASGINARFTEISFNTNLILGSDFTLSSAPGSDDVSVLSGNPSGFGDFSYTVGNHIVGGFPSPGPLSYSFELALTDPTQATINNFFMVNSAGNAFAAYMSTDINEGTNGYIAVGGPTPDIFTPVPSTLVMSTILIGIFGGVWSYRRVKATTAAA